MLKFASAIACRFCFIIHRWSEFEVSCNKSLVLRLCIHRQILMQVKSERLDNETAWYTCLLLWWPLCKRCICTLIRVYRRINYLDWLLLYFAQKCIWSNKSFLQVQLQVQVNKIRLYLQTLLENTLPYTSCLKRSSEAKCITLLKVYLKEICGKSFELCQMYDNIQLLLKKQRWSCPQYLQVNIVGLH